MITNCLSLPPYIHILSVIYWPKKGVENQDKQHYRWIWHHFLCLKNLWIYDTVILLLWMHLATILMYWKSDIVSNGTENKFRVWGSWPFEHPLRQPNSTQFLNICSSHFTVLKVNSLPLKIFQMRHFQPIFLVCKYHCFSILFLFCHSVISWWILVTLSLSNSLSGLYISCTAQAAVSLYTTDGIGRFPSLCRTLMSATVHPVPLTKNWNLGLE